jgi:ArsR family metal-binding transcriptional regulator
MVCDPKEWFAPTKPWVAIVHTKPDASYPTAIRQKVICRDDAEMYPMHGSGKVIRTICKDVAEQKLVIKNLWECNQRATAAHRDKPFQAYFAEDAIQKWLEIPVRLPEQVNRGDFAGEGFVYIQGIPGHIPDQFK